MPRIPSAAVVLALLAGSLSLIVAHALGRFAFTPLLPFWLNDGLLTLEQGARLATWNYVGYLVGALLALVLHAPQRQRWALPIALITNALITLFQGLTEEYTVLLLWRILNGITNGLVFVLAPALVLEWLAKRNQAQLSGWVYLGFAFGLLISNVLATGPASYFVGPSRWLPMAALAVPLALVSVVLLARLKPTESHSDPLHRANHSNAPLLDRYSIPLFIAYAGAGLGYILPMTFLPTLAQEQLPTGDPLTQQVWYWTAISCMAGIVFWNALSQRWGDQPALCATYGVQMLGAAAPLLGPGSVGIVVCALFVGGSFVGSVFLTQRLARALHPHQGTRLSAAWITVYGIAQLSGPWLAAFWLDQEATLSQCFALGAAALLWALVWSWKTPANRILPE